MDEACYYCFLLCFCLLFVYVYVYVCVFLNLDILTKMAGVENTKECHFANLQSFIIILLQRFLVESKGVTAK